MRRLAGLAVVAAAVLLETGCLVQITKVSDPEPLFQEARREAARYQGRTGPAHEINVLVYEPAEKQLVRVRVPMWIARKLERHVDRDDFEIDIDTGDDDDDEGRAVRRILRRRLRLADIEKTGLGTLVEVDEEDGEQVLVWLK